MVGLPFGFPTKGGGASRKKGGVGGNEKSPGPMAGVGPKAGLKSSAKIGEASRGRSEGEPDLSSGRLRIHVASIC